MARVSINHDAFARYEIVREIVRTDATCSWCGSNRQGRLFSYSVLPDDRLSGRADAIPGLFCSWSCCKDYHSD